MKTLAQAFIELAAHMEIAKFDDPDDAQAAEEVVSWCLVESSDDERSMLYQVASKRAAELRQDGASPNAIAFYENFVSRVTNSA